MATKGKATKNPAKQAPAKQAASKPEPAGKADVAGTPVTPLQTVIVPASSSAEVAFRFKAALAAHQRGDLAAAEPGYREVLALEADHFDALHMLGVLLAQQRRLADADACFLRALAIRPDDPSLHNNRGNVLSGLKRHDEAVRHFEQALTLNPGYADAQANLARALRSAGQERDAIAHYDEALRLKPDAVDIHYQRGMALALLRRNEEALAAFDRVLELRPGHPTVHFPRGNALWALRRKAEALIAYERAIAASPEDAEAHCNRGNVLQSLGHLADAQTSLERAVALKPALAIAHCLLGAVKADLGRLDEGVASLDEAIALQPDMAEAHNNRGLVLLKLKRFDEALRSFDRAIALRPAYIAAHANRGAALRELGRIDDALRSLYRSLELDGERADSYNIRGSILQDLNRQQEALVDYRRAQELRPGFAEAAWNESVCRLVLGDLEAAWPKYENRWQTDQLLGRIELSQPLWNGRPVAGKVLLWGEQGVGDQVLHLSMLEDARRMTDRIVVAVSARLIPLVKRSFADLPVISLQMANRQPCAQQLPMGSLGGFLRRSWKDFPQDRRSYLKADVARAAALRERVRRGDELVVGLSWISKAPKLGPAKSLALKELLPLLDVEGVRFVDLQYGDTGDERRDLRMETGIDVQHIDEIDAFADLDGLSALIEACDLVISISNTTVHLAGALGKETWVMVPYSCARHWYWHEGRSDSPWYPALQLFRQKALWEWEDVLGCLREALQAKVAGRRQASSK